MTALAPLLETFFLEHLPRERGASPCTLATYSDAWKLLVTFAARRLSVAPSDLPLEAIDAPLVLAFLDELETKRGNSVRTRNARLAATKSFFHFVEYRCPSALEQVRRMLAICVKKADQRLVSHLPAPQAQAILDSPDPTTRMGARDRAMLALALAGGLRVSELVGLRRDDLELSDHPTVRVRGKGRRERSLPLAPWVSIALRTWLAVRGDGLAPEIFLNARGRPLSRWGFTHILHVHTARAARQCPALADAHVSPHVLRHTSAMTVLQATHDIRLVALWLGHASLSTAEVYTRANCTEKLETLEAMVPPAMRRGRFKSPDRLLALLQAAKSSDSARDYGERR